MWQSSSSHPHSLQLNNNILLNIPNILITFDTYIFFISIEDDSLLDTYIINETPEDESPSSLTKRLVNRLGFSSHQTSGTETADINNNNYDGVFHSYL